MAQAEKINEKIGKTMEKIIIQQYSSKNTSINTKKLPCVYNALNLSKLKFVLTFGAMFIVNSVIFYSYF